jgi:hypothetical protein
MSDGRIVIAIPDCPPSMNRWLSKHWRVRHREKSEWESLLRLNFAKWGLPMGCERIEAQVTFRFPDRRRRDHDNHTATLSKCLGDALTPDYLVDDNTMRFLVTDSRVLDEVGPKETLIVLTYTLPKAVAA